MVDKDDLDSLEEFFSVGKPTPDYRIAYAPRHPIDGDKLISTLGRTQTVSASVETEVSSYSRCTLELVGNQEDLMTIIDILRRGAF